MGLTVIAFIGSVFSPYYKWARRKGPADPYQHCSINVALYGKGGKRWAMTERAAASVTQSRDRFSVGPSALTWDGQTLVIDIDEVTVPVPSRLRGRIRLTPRAIYDTEVNLDAPRNHTWWPMAPLSDVEVAFEKPDRQWRGTGYFDSNWGSTPLERSFSSWTWSRAEIADGAVALYDVKRRAGHGDEDLAVALKFATDGNVEIIESPPEVALKKAGWRIARPTRSEAPGDARVLMTMEDTPFYARSTIETRLCGETVKAVHESLSMDRFVTPVVQFMLPFKMPRVRRARR